MSLAEMATLAGLPQRPSDYSPFSRPKAAAARRRYVLRRMFEDGYISEQDRREAESAELTVYPRRELYLDVAPYYTEQVRREVVDRYGERALLEDGLQVYTALNVADQHFARSAIEQALEDLDKRQGFRGPLATLGRTELRNTFVRAYREQLGLEPGADFKPEKGQEYLAVVTRVDGQKNVASVNIAGVKALLPLAGMRWARKPNPTQRVDYHYLRRISDALSVGDIVTVEPVTRAALARDLHGGPIIDSVPKEGDFVQLTQQPIAQAALLSVDPLSGYVRAQVGGYEFQQSTYNRAVQACREPGSAFKPIVYSAAIDKLDYTASTLIDDKPLVFDDPDNAVRWKPNNAGMKFRGALPMRTCLKDSINTPAIRIAEAVGIDDVIKNARRLGITTELKRELGTALGSSCTTLFDLIQVYITLNRYGQRQEPLFIRRIVDRHGNVLEDNAVPWDPTLPLAARLDRAYRHLTEPNEQALDEQTAFLMVSLLRNVVEEGTGMGASRTGHMVAGKTGTTNDAYDAWFMGFTPKLVTGVWVGHDQKERPLGVSEYGGRTALPAWVAYTTKATLDYTKSPVRRQIHGTFEPPAGVVQASIDRDTGLLARPGSSRAVDEYYRAGTEPTELSPDRSMLNPAEFDVFGADTPL